VQPTDKVIINFTQRHRNYLINYFFLREHQDKLVFAGLAKERDLFCKNWNLDIPLLEPDNFYHLAQNIKHCKFFLGNQSFCFQIAEALKVPRILELFPMMPNVVPIGENAYDFYHQGGVEYYFNKMIK
jgi:ADP-heptose:LPS heptosyltransferase